MIRVLVADASTRITDNIAKRLGLEEDILIVGTARDGEQAVQEALRLQPDVVLIDAGIPNLDGVQATELLAQHLPATGVIMMSMEGENESIRHAMLAGAREFLLKPFKGDELVAAVQRVYNFEQRKVPAPAPAPAKAAKGGKAAAPTAPAGPTRGRVVMVVAGKGGVGKSVLCANTAIALTGGGTSTVCIVDLSLQFGDIGALLNIENLSKTIEHLAANDAVADPDMVHQVLTDGPGGIRVLLAPTSPEMADLVTTSHLRALIEQLRTSFDYVLLDSGSYLNEITLEGVDIADQIVLVTDFSVPSIKNARLVLEVLGVLRVDPANVVVVLNHRDAPPDLDSSHVQSLLKYPIGAEIPYDPGVVSASVSQGVPFILAHPESPASNGVRQLATRLAPQLAVPGQASSTTANSDDKKKRPRRILGFARS